MLMGAGVSYPQFEKIAKKAFVEEALGEPDPRGRTTNTSRVAVRTGLSRKEVAKVRQELATNAQSAETFQIGRPARALQLWHSELDFLDENGRPLDLAFDIEEPSFTTLVKRVGGDVPAGAVRAELLSAGGMIELPNGKFRVQKRFYVPSEFGEDLVVGFAFIVSPMLETLSHNLTQPSAAYIQRVAYSDHVPGVDVPFFREFGHRNAAEFMQRIDQWLTEHEVSGAASETENIDRRVGIGVFYFENAGAART
jgi:Family of unknown function (DUF6502)